MIVKIKKLLVFICLAIAILAVANFAMAAEAGTDFGLEQAAGTGLGNIDPRIIAANIIRIILGFLGILAVGLIIFAGWLWMTAEGAEEKVERAKKILLGAVIGLAICLASFAIASFVLNGLLNATDSTGGGDFIPGNVPGGGGGGGGGGLPGENQPCLKDSLDVQCAAGQCAAGLTCQASTCTCKRENRPGEGQSCDGDTVAAGCQASECSSDLVCSAGDNCTCIRTPIIAWISPVNASSTPNGAVGNFITIGGRYFGTTTGQVIFMGDPNNANDDKVAALPNQVNPQCSDYWQDNQIIAVVPSGAISGPIKVIDSKNKFDTTDNNRGARLNDFLVNSLVRPGLCLANPSSGALATPFNLQGNAFNGTTRAVLFGSALNSVAANNIANWTNLSVNATVPNIADGRNSVFVRVESLNSNSLYFTVTSATSTNPVIEYIEPAQGPVGQYITIYGRNFKTYNAQSSSVKFYRPADPQNLINADIDFSAVCRNNWWHNTYIVVKVPKVDADKLGGYKVVVTNNENRTTAPADFTITSGSAGPGLCLLEPNNGPVSQPVSAYGERFGAAQGSGRVQYFNNKDGAVRGWADKKIDSNVPNGAATGPVKIINGQAIVSNSLPFRVGSCSATSQCESGEECCGGGTYWPGICRPAGTCSQGSPIGCGFGWTFKTSGGDCSANQEKCDIPNALGGNNSVIFHCCARGQCNALTGQCDGCAANQPDQCDGDLKCCSTGSCKDLDGDGRTECSDGESCSGYGLSQCNSSYFCPNSPGQCSTYAGGGVTQTGDCDYGCNNFPPCQTNKCEYNAALNKCVFKNQTCNLPKTVKDAGNNDTEARCVKYNNQNRWQISGKTSCPSGWTNIGGGNCVENNTTCQLCTANFKCLAQGAQGVCAIDQAVCASGSTCLSNNKCSKVDVAGCECCCRIGHSSEDCCSPLECAGNCGSDKGSADTNTYGSCSGCGAVGATQAEHNAACNCSGTSGKFCLIDSANPTGVCRDCAAISDASVCSGQGVGVCCVDAKNNNACRGGTAPYASGSPSYNYCAYYKCDALSCASTPVATSSLMTYPSLAECNNKCAPVAQLGNTCFAAAATTQSCDVNKCIGFACINEDGSGPAASSCGTCCCDPFAAQDSCKNLNSVLVCKPNQAPCSGGKRGLCCGCSRDSECGGASIGCGDDTCCHTRPAVIDTVPAAGATNVCRNGLIQATFDQPMQTGSFSANIIVAGEYGLAACPANTKYLTAYQPSTIFDKLLGYIKKLPLLDKIFINQAQALSGNFCTVNGAVRGYNTADNKTTIEFKPQQALEANRKYYVIIKGDSDISDALNNGVLSQTGVGLGQTSSESFNGVTFKGKIWSFTAKNSTGADSGVCRVNAVLIKPAGYLFTTSINEVSDDDPVSANYDLVKDADKVFLAKAYSAENQPVTPIENLYNWKWDWSIDNQAVVKFKNGTALLDSPSQILLAQNVKEANTLVHAKITITQDTVSGTSSLGATKETQAQVYVFMCANPWPPFKDDGSWEPWRDAQDNCSVESQNCANTNFELYYCRDAGDAGTADDLPAILSDQAVIRGATAEQDILKELYFFREGAPDISGINLATTTTDQVRQGGKAALTWQPITVPAGQTLDKYQVYYGNKAKVYTQSLPAAAPGTAGNPFTVSGLTNGTRYYFAVTARYKSGAESDYSNEVSSVPADVWAPLTPVGLTVKATSTAQVTLNWQANQDDTATYKIYFGALSGSLGASTSLAKNKCSVTTGKCEVAIGNLSVGVRYYFAATALDLKGNESLKSTEINLIIQ